MSLWECNRSLKRLINIVERKHPGCKCIPKLKDYEYWEGYEVRRGVEIIKRVKFKRRERREATSFDEKKAQEVLI